MIIGISSHREPSKSDYHVANCLYQDSQRCQTDTSEYTAFLEPIDAKGTPGPGFCPALHMARNTNACEEIQRKYGHLCLELNKLYKTSLQEAARITGETLTLEVSGPGSRSANPGLNAASLAVVVLKTRIRSWRQLNKSLLNFL